MKTLTSLLVASLFSLACFGQGNVIPPEPEIGTARVKMIAGVGMFNTVWDWQRTPWDRIDDSPDITPVLVIVATDRSACVVTGKEWALARAGDRHACASAWRMPRG